LPTFGNPTIPQLKPIAYSCSFMSGQLRLR
jgi:hypothetical protein